MAAQPYWTEEATEYEWRIRAASRLDVVNRGGAQSARSGVKLPANVSRHRLNVRSYYTKEAEMAELTRSESRLLSRVSRIHVNGLKTWTTIAGAIAIFIAVIEIIMAYTDKEYGLNFWRMFSLALLGGSMIETPRLYGLIQSLSKQCPSSK